MSQRHRVADKERGRIFGSSVVSVALWSRDCGEEGRESRIGGEGDKCRLMDIAMGGEADAGGFLEVAKTMPR